uniref:EF-hand domain-containing protein n=1 Tax=Lotharella globosa TaxID=91324 RepID=A0A7S4DPJ2_9EUKA
MIHKVMRGVPECAQRMCMYVWMCVCVCVQVKECKTKEEIAHRIFDGMDDDKSGQLDKEEFVKQVSKFLGEDASEDGLPALMFKSYDKENGGTISKEEFTESVLKATEKMPEEKAIRHLAELLMVGRQVKVGQASEGKKQHIDAPPADQVWCARESTG